ncbi:hypothetical protein JOM56_001615 [Amanita muscaria]
MMDINGRPINPSTVRKTNRKRPQVTFNCIPTNISNCQTAITDDIKSRYHPLSHVPGILVGLLDYLPMILVVAYVFTTFKWYTAKINFAKRGLMLHQLTITKYSNDMCYVWLLEFALGHDYASREKRPPTLLIVAKVKEYRAVMPERAITRDETRSTDPEEFRSERFFNKDVSLIDNNIGYVFGFGRRIHEVLGTGTFGKVVSHHLSLHHWSPHTVDGRDQGTTAGGEGCSVEDHPEEVKRGEASMWSA